MKMYFVQYECDRRPKTSCSEEEMTTESGSHDQNTYRQALVALVMQALMIRVRVRVYSDDMHESMSAAEHDGKTQILSTLSQDTR